ncbi:hypothetical protein L7F22_003743 [Adiantum nelumboides]|nr:hypothetical protein [Adiantum nelumboides]
MAESNTNVSIEKLEKGNYQPWKFCMRNYLMDKSLWGYATGEEIEPELPQKNISEAELKAWKAWNKKDKKVMFLVSQNVSNNMIRHIQELNSAKEAWDALEKLYTTNTRARKIQLKNELNNMKKSQGMSVNVYVLKIKHMGDILKCRHNALNFRILLLIISGDGRRHGLRVKLYNMWFGHRSS